uniref:Uncharacterized protein n=1 Tax=Homalodisca liturata TaxID=320908 RepID=A0A1B6J2P9_9HEMI
MWEEILPYTLTLSKSFETISCISCHLPADWGCGRVCGRIVDHSVTTRPIFGNLSRQIGHWTCPRLRPLGVRKVMTSLLHTPTGAVFSGMLSMPVCKESMLDGESDPQSCPRRATASPSAQLP